jgi:hypothetical protein
MPRADDDDDVAEDEDDDDERTFGSGAKATTDEKRTVKTRRMERIMVTAVCLLYGNDDAQEPLMCLMEAR